jgi:FHA domain
MDRLILNYEGVGLVTHELVRDIAMIGRAPSNHIVIDHPAVSAQHALLLRVRDSYWLKDLIQRTGVEGWRQNPIRFRFSGFCRRLLQTHVTVETVS